MKHFYLFFILLVFTACSKEDTYTPYNLKDGQIVEVQVSHRYGALNDPLTLLPQNKPLDVSLYYFDDRKPGYNYRLKAKVVVPQTPPQDGAAYHLEFTEMISENKYEGDEPFEIALIQAPSFVAPTIILTKQGQHYMFGSKIELTYHDAQTGKDLEEIWQYSRQRKERYQAGEAPPELKWKAIKATVTHDPDNFGKAYLVSHIEFVE